MRFCRTWHANTRISTGFQRVKSVGMALLPHPRYSDVVARFVTAGQSHRFPVQAPETLAVIAYRRVPAPKSRQFAVLEVDSVVRTLVDKGLVEQVGTTAATGASLYGTTVLFLEKMGMNSLDDLAPWHLIYQMDADLDDVEKELR